MDRRRFATVVLLVVGASLAGGAWNGGSDVGSAGDPPPDRIVRPADDETAFWPYTSRRESVDGRTLALNVVVLGDPDRVERLLTDRTSANWSQTDQETALSASPWRPTHGSPRYTYVRRAGREGHWTDADYQLGVGDYLGRQLHVRAYPVRGRETTVLQAHTEYWDWFRLRHTVTGIDVATAFVERDLRSVSGDQDVGREYHGLGGGRNDGWISVVDLRGNRSGRRNGSAAPATGLLSDPVRTGDVGAGGSAPLDRPRPRDSPGFFPGVDGLLDLLGLLGLLASAVPAMAVTRTRIARIDAELWRDVLLVVALVGLVVGVRTLGINLENLLPGVDPKYFGLVCYPTLVLGPLAAVRAFAPGRPRTRTVTLAGAGFGAGIVLDFGAVGVTSVPVDVALHRFALVGALALVAAGTSQRDRRLTAVGVGAWLLGLAMPLAGFV